MEEPKQQADRLEAIKQRWFNEPLATPLVPLTSGETPPKTIDEFVQSMRVTSAFSGIHFAPDLANMTDEDALAEDRRANLQHVGVEDPHTLMQELRQQFQPDAPPAPDTLKKGACVLDKVREENIELATGIDAEIVAMHQADAEALKQALGIISDYAAELGISLPLSRGRRK